MNFEKQNLSLSNILLLTFNNSTYSSLLNLRFKSFFFRLCTLLRTR